MDIDSEIKLPTIKIKNEKEKIIHECPVCGKKYKTEKSFLKHLETHEELMEKENMDNMENIETVENEKPKSMLSKLFSSEDKQNDRQKKIEKLQKELEQLILSNPNIDISKPCQDTTLDKIYEMSEDELKSRIFDAKRNLTSGLDMKISDGVLSFTNTIVGNMLGCLDELEESVNQDKMLRQATKDLLSFSVLSYVPPNVKVAGLYAINVGTAVNKARSKTKTMIEEIKS
jgi:uncharacterized C2H2 Zn-finger protein